VAEQVADVQKAHGRNGAGESRRHRGIRGDRAAHQFLTRQYDDLVQAKAELLDIINRINTQTQEMFTETFNKFATTFARCSSRCSEVAKPTCSRDAGDVLESGIDIVARPPGQTIADHFTAVRGEQP